MFGGILDLRKVFCVLLLSLSIDLGIALRAIHIKYRKNVTKIQMIATLQTPCTVNVRDMMLDESNMRVRCVHSLFDSIRPVLPVFIEMDLRPSMFGYALQDGCHLELLNAFVFVARITM